MSLKITYHNSSEGLHPGIMPDQIGDRVDLTVGSSAAPSAALDKAALRLGWGYGMQRYESANP